MRKLLVSICILCLTGIAAAEEAGIKHPQNLEFSIKLLKALHAQKKNDKSLVCSPWGLQQNLSLIYPASDGHTKEQLASILGDSDPQHFLKICRFLRTSMDTKIQHMSMKSLNLFLYDKTKFPFNDSYREIFKDDPYARFYNEDFRKGVQLADALNELITKETHGKIKRKLVSPHDFKHPAVLFLLSCVNFDARWDRGFMGNNYHHDFYLTPTQKRNIPMMGAMHKNQIVYRDSDWESLTLALKDSHFYFTIIQPRQFKSVAKLVETISDTVIAEHLRTLHAREINIYLPEFTINSGIPLDATLQTMGLEKIFRVPHMLTKDKDLPYECIRHFQENTIIVKKHGVSAASATGMAIIMGIPRADTSDFIANKPFIYLLWHAATSTPIFIGWYSL